MNPEPHAKSDHAQLIAAFDAAYRERTGTGATWGKERGANVKRLLAAHGLAVCVARVERLFSRSWWFAPQDTAPTFDMLVRHFDELAPPLAHAEPEALDPDVAYYVEGDRWCAATNLAAVERDFAARGLDMPWRKSPRRARMTHDLAGNPLEPVAANGQGGKR